MRAMHKQNISHISLFFSLSYFLSHSCVHTHYYSITRGERAREQVKETQPQKVRAHSFFALLYTGRHIESERKTFCNAECVHALSCSIAHNILFPLLYGVPKRERTRVLCVPECTCKRKRERESESERERERAVESVYTHSLLLY